jgi:hypothetical protein
MKKCMFKCLIVAIALNLFVGAYYHIADRLNHPVQPKPVEQIFRASTFPEGFIKTVDLDDSPGSFYVRTLYHNGRTYDVIYGQQGSFFQAIRVK